MPTNQRSSQMREFAESKGLMTNARCLTEGVDLPAIDCVVFTDPKKSKVDIVQAAGRALRLSPGKKFGYILIPLIIPENENATEAAKDTAFEEIVATIRALATHDTRIIEYLRAVSSGTIPKGGSPVDGITKINVLTKVNEEEFNKSIQLQVWDRVAFGNWRPFEEVKKYAQSLNFNTSSEWYYYCRIEKKLPLDLPRKPDSAYKNCGWVNWGDFLGTGNVASYNKVFIDFYKARKIIKKLNFKSQKDWKNFCNSKNYKSEIPKNPPGVYKNRGWINWADFLGSNNIATQKKKFLSYSKAKIALNKEKIENANPGWRNYLKSKKRNLLIPSQPDQYYLNKGWKGWSDFLGQGYIKKGIRQRGNYKSFISSKIYVQKLNLRSYNDWCNYCKSKNKPNDIPPHPHIVYKNSGWKGWPDFLGYIGIKPRSKKS